MLQYDKDVVLSSRIRLARNVKDIPFPTVMTEEQGKKVIELARKAILGSNTILSTQFTEYEMKKLTPLDRQALVEKHLISPDLSQNIKTGYALIKDDNTVSIMVNEEDHLRIQCILPGLKLDESWDMADKIDDLIEETIDYAYDEKIGYLTSCPTNVGTGIRASVMVHLPALTITGQISNILNSVSKIGMAVRGIYGEGTQALGDIYQISNQVTLGQSEKEIIENIEGVAKQIISSERRAREELYKKQRVQIEDRVGRAFGILSHAKVMSTKEYMTLMSDVRLGIVLGILSVDLDKLDRLTTQIQPANLQKIYGMQLNPYERDVKRAEYVSTQLNKKE
ncbi:MAG: Putative ATP:guanido phosphotransferase [Caldanaerobacter subterraneus]|uniref:Protein-arginine kinase n=4 Tax=Caldanaerobacter subterraneus TaxID=911092 RepID=MCSB_CALS4|nr:protein arginine kinase [Caldanaerobacter subterraneus]Q8R7S0.1 RecName: Full=Protein-arginine kinase [Caldanaerobacter subterraneus subsp. tengcongensis MB4]MDK2794402.1 protein arginine kinase [Caldanaerobacter sp.]AAM25469.1 creatine kinase [Caldanaerobacter subterraneus subsp. tengcongensis MB4]ERM91040.1 ATP:guanido phosphotransferase [Caldanaerobacter subterraneus subsp. yonseiensis KB-1]KUK08952.1 MAG: Putative ATP:guanido phosphotransferase [Caldanaerobacter subterraneus]MBE3579953